MISLKAINKEKVKPIPKPKIDEKKIKGFSMFPEPYANIFLLGRKKSGKTTVIFNILKKCIDKDTRLVIFSSTAYKDASWLHIINKFKKTNQVDVFLDIGTAKESNLEPIIEELNAQAELEMLEKEKAENETEEPINFIKFNEPDEEDKPKKKRKKKKLAPEIVFIFDDLGSDNRSIVISNLLKTNRHYKSKVIISSQYLHDLQPQSIKQLDYLLCFNGLTDKKLEKAHLGLDLTVNLPTFKRLYDHATSKKYCFLYIDVVNSLFRNCFNKEYSIQ